MKQCFAEK
ncbi:hypothetical protein CGLO_18169 [Colletotrichum gloeosporioides Cg-14]|uniref:Uncharacterized protein n=1 Tax=Colletotrichum gloeosporioides (strain Cg-14) TaxID=1237896 RepID=T0JIJ5_COLGC|nr:hypothetical protein CGLO_18169 [Colletotrichum gloeosporioides Cg-14]